jgi:two-component system nitrogen regulation response regulator GlnG
MPLQVQSKILRVLQEGEFSRVGGNQTLRTDVRILAATNRPLERDVETGRFREDLFYRLNVIRIHIPPLRERHEDVLPLANFFLQRLAREHRLPPHRLSEEAIRHLEDHHWPGNVRELENTLARACVLATADVLLPKDIPLGSAQLARPGATAEAAPVAAAPAEIEPLDLAAWASRLLQEAEHSPGLPLLAAFERELVLQAHARSGDKPAVAAKLLGLTAATYAKKLKAAQA